MYAVEIAFKDSKSDHETILVRRAIFTLGGGSAQVAIEDLNTLGFQYKFTRGIGRSFSLRKVDSKGQPINNEEVQHNNFVVLDAESAVVTIIALDIDLVKKESEPLDKAGIRLLKRALSNPIPKEVSLKIQPVGLIISFSPDEPVQVGRGKNNNIRLDFNDISSVHAKFGYQDGNFWIEDLGSTNGTFIDGKQISGRVAFGLNQTIVLGREVRIRGEVIGNSDNKLNNVVSQNQVEEKSDFNAAEVSKDINDPKQEARERRLSLVKPIAAYKSEQGIENASHIEESRDSQYPALLTLSAVARPARVVLQGTRVVKVGRDPSCEMWLGAPHISRLHCSFQGRGDDEVIASDSSTNGTSYGKGILKKGDSLEIKNDAVIFDFGGGVTLAVCFNAEQEKQFIDAGGDPKTFLPKPELDGTIGFAKEQVDGLKRLSEQVAGRFKKVEEYAPKANSATVTRSRPIGSTKPIFTAKIIVLIGVLAIILGVFVAVVGSLLVSLF